MLRRFASTYVLIPLVAVRVALRTSPKNLRLNYLMVGKWLAAA